MSYPELMIRPMREEVTRYGVKELRTVGDVDAVLANPSGTQLVFVNSVCGCAAGGARPALALALQHKVKPEQLYSVFAGADVEATARVRSYCSDYEPSSPSIVLFRDGEVVHVVHRHMIEGRHPQAIAAELVAVFDKYCGVATSKP